MTGFGHRRSRLQPVPRVSRGEGPKFLNDAGNSNLSHMIRAKIDLSRTRTGCSYPKVRSEVGVHFQDSTRCMNCVGALMGLDLLETE